MSRTGTTAPRPYRPIAGEPISWSPGFGRRFIVFVDVEEEFDWRAPLDRANRSTTAMAAFPEAHCRFSDRGVGLTCMVDYPIATDPAAVAILRRIVEDGRSAIGTQLHAWVNPPFEEEPTPANSYAGNLPERLEAAKLERLTAAIEASFGERPLAFRAGRYGIGPRTLPLLAAAGYRLDSSVRAGYDYGASGGPDFSGVGSDAWREAGIIELPLTTVHIGLARRGSGALHRALGRVPGARAAFARTGLLARVALTPEDMPIEAALAAVEVAAARDARLLVFSFHSPSLQPGHTPYVRDVADLARFHRWWSRMLDRLDRLGIRPASLAEVLAAAT